MSGPHQPQMVDNYLGGFSGGARELLERVRALAGEAVPDDLLRRMIAFRVREHEDDGVLWL